IYNLHRKYRKILVTGKILPEAEYGPYAVSRGNSTTRLITLRNLSWYPVKYNVSLNGEIGLTGNKKIKFIQAHPYEKFIGSFNRGKKLSVTVEPFRSALYIATTEDHDEPLIRGAAFNVVRNVKGKNILIDISGGLGSKAAISLVNFNRYSAAFVNGVSVDKLVKGGSFEMKFPGKKLKLTPHRKIAVLKESDVPDDSSALYEATVFAADNNALEVRSLYRSGESHIPAVKKARGAFFDQKTFKERGILDKNLFDSDLTTGFWPSRKYDIDLRVKRGALRLDLGRVTQVGEILVRVPDIFSLQPLLPGEGNYVEISSDLKKWKTITYKAGLTMTIPINGEVRYLRFRVQPSRIVEIEGYYKGKSLDRSRWRASNLFAHAGIMNCIKSWRGEFSLAEIPKSSYLSVAVNGKHGVEGAYAAMKIGAGLIGAPDRAPSFPSNTWEYVVAKKDKNYTYYFPLKDSYKGKKIEVFVLAYDKENTKIDPEAWISTRTETGGKIRLELIQKQQE
ncbi:MAG: hypothetical protein ABFR36_02845, partial [Acidobacteriota bacterium]